MFSTVNLVRLGMLAATLIGATVYAYSRKREGATLPRLLSRLLAVYALAHILFIMFLWVNHIAFPLNLEAMELTVLAHLKRVKSGLPLYVEPSPEFVALAYNPLYYFLSVPFAWLFGANLFTLRLVAILGMLGSEVVIFLAVQRNTNSKWWGLLAVGLFAAAYRVMDTYLDNAFPDSWMLFAVLLGCYLIDLHHSRTSDLVGILLIVTAFWFKQPGAIFAIGAVLFLTWREGWRKSWLFWLLAGLLGPGLYFAAQTWPFGPRFHYFTFEVPRQWTQFNLYHVFTRIGFLTKSYLLLAVVSTAAYVFSLQHARRENSIWYFMLPFALLSASPGILDPESANNLYIPIGVWFIVSGIIGLKQLTDRLSVVERWGLHLFALGTSFALLLYNPSSVIVSPQAAIAYQDMVDYLEALDGPVYAPWLGQLQEGYQFYPAVHRVPMEDMIRGPGVNERNNHPLTRKLLEPVLNPKGKAYILMNYPLENDSLLAFLTENYVLETDLGERFAPLSTLPKRFNLLWPRYLYRYAPREASEQAPDGP